MPDPASIFVVDDEATFRLSIQLLAPRAFPGVAVSAYATPAEALEAIASLEAPPDWAMLDFNLKAGGYGFELIAPILIRFPGARVGMLSTSAYARDIDEARRAGSQFWIQKTGLALPSRLVKAWQALSAPDYAHTVFRDE